MIQTIPLRPGAAFQRFRVNLSGRVFRVRLYWSTRFSMFSADIHEGETPIVLGRGLHPGIDLFKGLNLGIGKLYLEGRTATVDNLGVDNQLRYET